MRPDAGRTFHERVSRATYVTLEQALADPATDSHGYGVWLPPERWSLPDLRGKRVAIVANSTISGLGRQIDTYDEVMRLNRMPEWRQLAAEDGVRMTMWAGLANAAIIPTDDEKARFAPWRPSCLPEKAGGLSLIWAVTPFHVSARFMRFVHASGLADRLVVTGGAGWFHDRLKGELPEEMFRRLYTLRMRHARPLAQFTFDVMLTGVRTVLFAVLAGAAEIALFGFTFFSDPNGRPTWSGHDVEADRWFFNETRALAERRGILFLEFGGT